MLERIHFIKGLGLLHDTNPAVDLVNVVDGELRTFVVRALAAVHKRDV